jgi:thioredoxin reductase
MGYDLAGLPAQERRPDGGRRTTRLTVRVSSAGVSPGGAPIALSYQGKPVVAREGDTIAAALVDGGHLTCGEARAGGGRGLFCGMGVCNECAVVVDGRPGRLACATAAEHGMSITVQPSEHSLEDPSAEDFTELEISPDLLVLGAGPAGMSAAAAAAEAGLDVLLIDERAKLGGQYFKQPSSESQIDQRRLDAQYRSGRALIDRLLRSGAEVATGVRVWGAFGPDLLFAAGERARWTLRPRRLIIAGGAYERGVPMPGWTLPGVMTTGGAQTLLRGNQVAPGTRLLISGNGPLNLQLAASLVEAGVTVVALAEIADLRWTRNLGSGIRMALTAPRLVREGLRYRATLARARVPVYHRSAVVRMEGDETVRRAWVAGIDRLGRSVPGTEREFDVDAVCVGFGFLSSNQIARSLGCTHRYDESTGNLVAEHDEAGRTSVPGVWVVGDGAGVRGAPVAEAMGVLASADAIRSLEGEIPVPLVGEEARARRALRRAERFQTSLWSAYSGPVLTDQLADDDTVVCRCERVTLREIEDQIDTEAETAGALKRLTRAGMGACQGRYCGPVLTELAARRSGRPIDELAGFAPQIPYHPTEVGILAEPHPRHDRSPG